MVSNMTKTDNQLINNYNYVKNSGQQCPSCEAYEVTTTDHVETDGGFGWQEVRCDSCEATWQDVYTLTGYDNLEKANI